MKRDAKMQKRVALARLEDSIANALYYRSDSFFIDRNWYSEKGFDIAVEKAKQLGYKLEIYEQNLNGRVHSYQVFFRKNEHQN